MLKAKLLFILFLSLVAGCGSLQERRAFKVKSYVKVYAIVVATKCEGTTKDKESVCKDTEFISAGSGAIVHHEKNKSFILTAGHVCTVELPKAVSKDFDKLQAKYKIQTSDSKVIDAVVKHVSPEFINGKELDLCLLQVRKLDLPKLHFSKEGPKLGERLYTMSSPIGAYNPPAPILFSGHYSGKQGAYHCVITIPAAPGSSGAPIVNSRGELVSMIFAVNVRLNHLTLCINHETLKEFLHENL